MPHIDQRGKRGMRAVVPSPGSLLAASILRRRDDFEIAALQLFVDFLPA
jgi:hypothetical protein